mgnify:CR=1 FL=1
MIRKFRENDLPSIMQIWFDSNVEVHSFIPEKYWMDNFEMVKDILPQAEIYVYENLGKISGFIGLNKDYIEGIFVEKNMRSKGIGKQLWEYLKENSSNDEFTVNSSPFAVPVYHKLGFVDTNTEQLTDGIRYTPMKYMRNI